eukprot:TRINITY_DN5748_c0_g1_i1.p3 TRINITY_DN5748_c0_g1~~TRINITY_DN5748_c0_g1_i1.p3  ORF type:complete len:264 (-),score=-11.18 TRINITY_DN5748_c0_g1_i1:934-1725(-)
MIINNLSYIIINCDLLTIYIYLQIFFVYIFLGSSFLVLQKAVFYQQINMKPLWLLVGVFESQHVLLHLYGMHIEIKVKQASFVCIQKSQFRNCICVYVKIDCFCLGNLVPYFLVLELVFLQLFNRVQYSCQLYIILLYFVIQGIDKGSSWRCSTFVGACIYLCTYRYIIKYNYICMFRYIRYRQGLLLSEAVRLLRLEQSSTFVGAFVYVHIDIQQSISTYACVVSGYFVYTFACIVGGGVLVCYIENRFLKKQNKIQIFGQV